MTTASCSDLGERAAVLCCIVAFTRMEPPREGGLRVCRTSPSFACTVVSSIALLAATALWCDVLCFHYAVASCDWPDPASATSSGAVFRAVVIADVHVLGHRWRGPVDMAWTDGQLRRSVQALRWHKAQADVTIMLGDQIDEGTFSKRHEWQVRAYVVWRRRRCLQCARALAMCS